MVYYLILGIHVIVSLVLIVTVLLQSGKGGGLAGAFGGGGGSQAIFGGRGAATFLSKATTVLGTTFMLTALTLAVLQTRTGEQSALERDAARADQVFTLPQPGEGPLSPPSESGEAPAEGGTLPATGIGGEAPVEDAGSDEDPGGG